MFDSTFVCCMYLCTVMTVSIEESVTTVKDNVSVVIHMRYCMYL